VTMGSGGVISLPSKQNVNVHKLTEAKLVVVDDIIAKICGPRISLNGKVLR